MPMNAAALASSIEAEIKGTFPANMLADSEGQVGKLALAIATAVVSHITTSAVVTTTTSCPAGAGAGLGGVT